VEGALVELSGMEHKGGDCGRLGDGEVHQLDPAGSGFDAGPTRSGTRTDQVPIK
jgi:hypothetical protein